jgi:Flp pilus assembly pilin Flp
MTRAILAGFPRKNVQLRVRSTWHHACLGKGRRRATLAGSHLKPAERALRTHSKEECMKNLFVRFVREEEGQDLVEYAMLVALVAIICVAGVGSFGLDVNAFYEGIAGQIPLP